MALLVQEGNNRQDTSANNVIAKTDSLRIDFPPHDSKFPTPFNAVFTDSIPF
jgi:hypothetical protein